MYVPLTACSQQSLGTPWERKLSFQRRQSTNQRHRERNVNRAHRPVSSFSSGKQIYEVGELTERAEHSRPPPPQAGSYESTSQRGAETGQSHDRNSCMMRDHHPQPSSVSSRLSRKQVCLRLMKSSGQDAQPASIPWPFSAGYSPPKRVYFHLSSPDVTSALN